MHFILNKPVYSDHLSYVTIFQCSLWRSHKAGLTVYLKTKNKTGLHYTKSRWKIIKWWQFEYKFLPMDNCDNNCWKRKKNTILKVNISISTQYSRYKYNLFQQGVQHYVIKFVSDLRQVGSFLRFPPPIKLTAMI